MIKLRNTVLYALAATVLVAAGCTKHGLPSDPALVRFTSSATDFEVKSTDATLSNGDEVGIFAGNPIAAGNVRAVVSGKSILPDKELYWEDGQNVATRFSAYCPYTPGVPGEVFPFSVSEDQRLYADYARSDLRTASVTISPGNVVNFIFGHRLTKLIIDIDAGNRSVSEVSVRDVYRSATVDMTDGGLSAISNRGAVQAGLATASPESRVYVAIFIPASLQIGLVVTADGDDYHYTLDSPQEFLPGCAYYASLKLDEGHIIHGEGSPVNFSVTVTDWENGEPLEFIREP